VANSASPTATSNESGRPLNHWPSLKQARLLLMPPPTTPLTPGARKLFHLAHRDAGRFLVAAAREVA
jgi:hypothetical protein